MPLLADYALTPDVFDPTSYSNEEVCGLHLGALKEVLLAEGLVRDLRMSEWRRIFSDGSRPWHQRGKELIKKLAAQGRLISFAPTLPASPSDDRGWCAEALGTQAQSAISGGIIVTESVKTAFEDEPLVAQIDKLEKTPWWTSRSPSIRLGRTTVDYQAHLAPVLRSANSIMFIDPHLDPTKHGYREFGQLLARVSGRTPVPTLELHRVCYEGSGPGRAILGRADIESRFRRGLEAQVRAAGLRIEVFVWDDFHDRYLVSNILGILVPYGFDTTVDPKSVTTWTRLGQDTRDDVQREFDTASGRHTLRHQFTIP